jgi:hypothetical protein
MGLRLAPRRPAAALAMGALPAMHDIVRARCNVNRETGRETIPQGQPTRLGGSSASPLFPRSDQDIR